MKNIFKYTFLTAAEIKKLLLVIITVSILTVIQAYPVISIVSFIFEKLLYLSIGMLLIYIINITDTDKEFFLTLEKQPFSTFLLHFLPGAMGIMLGFMIIASIFFAFFVIILKFTASLFILADPHQFLFALSKTTMLAKVLLGFYIIYLLFFSYIILGKLGEALNKGTFKGGFLSIVSSLIDFKYWVSAFNFKYIGIYIIWAVTVTIVYSVISFAYIFYIFPLIINHPNFSLFIIPLLVAISTIVTYFTFFSAYFADKTIKD